MEIEIKTWLYDILSSIDEINSFTGVDYSFTNFTNDLKTRRAIERNIEIIGEAMNRILTKDDSMEFANSRKIVDTRNRIIHGYATVSDEIIWNIITQHLPILRTEIDKLLSSK